MPNFWTKATQAINETFSGPRTKDVEFEAMLNEFKTTEKYLLNFKNIFQHISNFNMSLKSSCSELYQTTLNIYEKDCPYAAVAGTIVNINAELHKITEEFNQKISIIVSKISKWSLLFDEVKTNTISREEARKDYDHYEEKMNKLIKTRHEKLKKNSKESQSDLEMYQRVYFINIE